MTNTATVAAADLRSYLERIERLESEKKALAEDIKEVFAEAKGTGLDVKAMKAILKKRAMDKGERDEQEALIDLYTEALEALGVA